MTARRRGNQLAPTIAHPAREAARTLMILGALRGPLQRICGVPWPVLAAALEAALVVRRRISLAESLWRERRTRRYWITGAAPPPWPPLRLFLFPFVLTALPFAIAEGRGGSALAVGALMVVTMAFAFSSRACDVLSADPRVARPLGPWAGAARSASRVLYAWDLLVGFLVAALTLVLLSPLRMDVRAADWLVQALSVLFGALFAEVAMVGFRALVRVVERRRAARWDFELATGLAPASANLVVWFVLAAWPLKDFEAGTVLRVLLPPYWVVSLRSVIEGGGASLDFVLSGIGIAVLALGGLVFLRASGRAKTTPSVGGDREASSPRLDSAPVPTTLASAETDPAATAGRVVYGISAVRAANPFGGVFLSLSVLLLYAMRPPSSRGTALLRVLLVTVAALIAVSPATFRFWIRLQTTTIGIYRQVERSAFRRFAGAAARRFVLGGLVPPGLAFAALALLMPTLSTRVETVLAGVGAAAIAIHQLSRLSLKLPASISETAREPAPEGAYWLGTFLLVVLLGIAESFVRDSLPVLVAALAGFLVLGVVSYRRLVRGPQIETSDEGGPPQRAPAAGVPRAAPQART